MFRSWPGVGGAPDEGFVHFDIAARAAERRKIAAAHDLVDAMRKKPSGLHAAIEGALNLPSADSFLAARDQRDCLEATGGTGNGYPLIYADPNGEGLAARRSISAARPACEVRAAEYLADLE